MTMSLKEHSPIERHYRDFKYFDQNKFENKLNKKLSACIANYESFETTFTEVLNEHSPLQKKFLRANQALFMVEALRKAIMSRSQLETIYLKTKTKTELKLYKKGKNYRTKLYKRGRRKHYELLNMKNILGSKDFWKSMKLFLSGKNTICLEIRIVKSSRIISEGFDLSEQSSIFFEDAVRLLNVKPNEYYLSDTRNLSDPLETTKMF